MAKTDYINVRIEPGLKSEAETILARLGLSTSDAMTLFFRQIVLNRGIPFPVRIPNEATRAALDEAVAAPHVGERFDSAEALMQSLWDGKGEPQ